MEEHSTKNWLLIKSVKSMSRMDDKQTYKFPFHMFRSSILLGETGNPSTKSNFIYKGNYHN